MAAIDQLIEANRSYARNFTGPPQARPRLHLAVLTCMDTRLDLLGALGLQIGDAHLIRNAGGVVTDDVLRSLAVSQRALGTREVAVLQHTQCGLHGFDDAAFRSDLAAESGQVPTWDVPGFTDVRESVRRSVRVLRECPWLPHREVLRGFVFDVATGTIGEV